MTENDPTVPKQPSPAERDRKIFKDARAAIEPLYQELKAYHDDGNAFSTLESLLEEEEPLSTEKQRELFSTIMQLLALEVKSLQERIMTADKPTDDLINSETLPLEERQEYVDYSEEVGKLMIASIEKLDALLLRMVARYRELGLKVPPIN